MKMTKEETIVKANYLDAFLDDPECINDPDFLLKVSDKLLQFNKDAPVYKLGKRLQEYIHRVT